MKNNNRKKSHLVMDMDKRRNRNNFAKVLTKKAVVKYFSMERARIHDYIRAVHVDGHQPIGFTTEELNTIDGDILLFLMDASTRVSRLDSRFPNIILQRYRRPIALLRQTYNDPIPIDDPYFATGGTATDIEFLLALEWSTITPDGREPPTTSSSTPPPSQ